LSLPADMGSNTKTSVLIVGGGPVGLTLAIDLGRRGISALLIEKRSSAGFWPKMEKCNARTMEFYRRLGIADTIRRAGYPTNGSMDIFVVTRLSDPPILTLHYPSVDEARAQARTRNDGTFPLEPYQIISQYTLEPVLRESAETFPSVDVRFGCELIGFDQDEGEVRAEVKTPDGKLERISADYLVGCDGGSSTVRKQLGIQLEGEGALAEFRQVLFRSDELLARIQIGQARHYQVVNAYASSIIVQSDRRHFAMNTTAPANTDFKAFIADVIGVPVPIEIVYVGSWTRHLLVAERYAEGRVFLAGDAVHLISPNGGLGMNTGVGDAMDLSWKLAGTLEGWGGPNLLRAYDSERRSIGLRNRDAARFAVRGAEAWRAAYDPCVREDTSQGAAAREKIATIAKVELAKSHEMTGIESGYRYIGSPLICSEPGDGPDPNAMRYAPTTWPGARLPHVWLANGEAVHDRLGDGFTLLRMGACRSTSDLERAITRLGAPFSICDLDDPAVRRVYGCDLILVRPDLHVVWRGDRAPTEPDAVAATATGH
jgi:2-polyprenyl-6-methoxyphenol hydroxylase-like FAD-dependent oxidoreductase